MNSRNFAFSCVIIFDSVLEWHPLAAFSNSTCLVRVDRQECIHESVEESSTAGGFTYFFRVHYNVSISKAFSSFPQTTFIWKYENSSDDFARVQASKIPNVILTEWMPQLDILGKET